MGGTAIFDLDRTLTRRGTWTRFMVRVNRQRIRFWLHLPLLGVHAVLYKLGFSSRLAVKQHGLTTLRWASRAHLEQMAEAFAADEIATGLRTEARNVLAAHRAAGDRLVLATAAADLTAVPIGRALGFDLILATLLEWSGQGHLTGRLDGANCYGEAKLQRVREADSEHGFARPVTAYSDHVSDLPFLAWADTGVAVNPSRGLRRVASSSGFVLADWELSTTSGQEEGKETKQ